MCGLSNLLIGINRDMITSVSLLVATPFMIKFLWLAHVLLYKLSLEASFFWRSTVEWTHKHALEACLDLDRAISVLSTWWCTPTTTSSTMLYCTDNRVYNSPSMYSAVVTSCMPCLCLPVVGHNRIVSVS